MTALATAAPAAIAPLAGHIHIDGVGKAYRRYARRRDLWLEVLSLGALPRHQAQWVLKPLSLHIQPGESVGLIGYNGAGKSTLLKLVAGVTPASVGAVHVSGRVAAILELGIGFHFELTGRQNIPLAGQLIGHSASELLAREAEIIAFAELGDMIDQPLRAYSSGMLARLAFAVASAIRPDILIVDEALSVGDAYFQHKSFARIREFKRFGTTTLFVSHDFSAVRTLCDRVLLFNAGELVQDGPPDTVLDYYNALIAEREASAGIPALSAAPSITQEIQANGQAITRSGTGEVKLQRVEVIDAQGAASLRFATGDAVTVCVHARTLQAVDCLVAGIMLRDRAGNPVFGTNAWHLRQPLLRLPPDADASFYFQLPLNLGSGSYSVSVALVDSDTHLSRNFDWQDNLLVFEVTNLAHPPFVGMAYLPARLEARRSYAEWDLNRYASRVHSQFAEDGILQRLFEVVSTTNRFCVEFGGYDGLTMSNAARLIAQDGWHCGFIEADPALFKTLVNHYAHNPKVRAINAFVSPDNIEALLSQLEAPPDLDLLCIDIDGNDYWVWQAITNWRPRVIVTECNGAYPPPQKWVMAYNPAHSWQGDDYYGASPQSLVDLAKSKDYELVCCEEQGANLFFVRADLYPLLGIPDNRLETLYRPPRYGLPEHNWTHPHRNGPHEVV